MYGPNTEAVQAIIDRISTLTEDECKQLTAIWDAAWGAGWNATRYAAWGAGRSAAWGAGWNATRYAAMGAAWGAARDAAWDAPIGASRDAAWYASRDAVLATVTYDLATDDGPYTIAQRDLLLAPWVSVCGMPQ